MPDGETCEDEDPGYLASVLPVWPLASGSITAVSQAADRLRAACGLAVNICKPDPSRIAASFASERFLRVNGKPVSAFAELSGFFPARNGWVRTHANYPHHRYRLLKIIDLPEGTTRDEASRRIAQIDAQDIEDQAAAEGAIAVRVRTEHEWRAGEPCQAAATGPLVKTATRTGTSKLDFQPTAQRPLAGIRVLDCTRVLAGPIAGRTLALLGASVLRVDPPDLPEIAWQHIDTGPGKHTAILDAADPRFTELLDQADVLLTGYRPGSIESRLPSYPDGLVIGRVNAWGDDGPWARRRGFDSIVQAVSGIALIEGAPGALPAQVLDHASGYHLAAGIIDSLTDSLADGRGRDVSVALARTAAELLSAPGRNPNPSKNVIPADSTVVVHGDHQIARPAVPGYDDYPFPAHPWGTDEPAYPGVI